MSAKIVLLGDSRQIIHKTKHEARPILQPFVIYAHSIRQVNLSFGGLGDLAAQHVEPEGLRLHLFSYHMYTQLLQCSIIWLNSFPPTGY